MAANLHVRNIDDGVVANMKQRAAELRSQIENQNGGERAPRSEVLIRQDRDSL